MEIKKYTDFIFKEEHEVIYRETLEIAKDTANRIKRDLSCRDPEGIKEICERYGKDYTESYTVIFLNKAEMDIKLCCSNLCDEADQNPLWTEAVLFINGSETGCTDVSDEFFGEWKLGCGDDTYIVNVVAAAN